MFKNKKVIADKLLNYGFSKNGSVYNYSADILGGEFELNVTVAGNTVKTRLIEVETGELYTLHLTHEQGDFIGQVRDEYNKILSDIAQKCFVPDVFKSTYVKKIIEYVNEKYNDELEYLWEKFPDNAIVRRKDNSKWYLLILTVKQSKLGLKSENKTEIINLRVPREHINELLQQDNIYPAYHMNKKSWVTLLTDGSTDIKDIFKYIDISYDLAGK